MTKRKTKLDPQPLKKVPLYRAITGIAYDGLGERYNPGDIDIDLSRWPEQVIDLWLANGKIEEM